MDVPSENCPQLSHQSRRNRLPSRFNLRDETGNWKQKRNLIRDHQWKSERRINEWFRWVAKHEKYENYAVNTNNWMWNGRFHLSSETDVLHASESRSIYITMESQSSLADSLTSEWRRSSDIKVYAKLFYAPVTECFAVGTFDLFLFRKRSLRQSVRNWQLLTHCKHKTLWVFVCLCVFSVNNCERRALIEHYEDSQYLLSDAVRRRQRSASSVNRRNTLFSMSFRSD